MLNQRTLRSISEVCQQEEQQQAPRLEGATISPYSSVSDVKGTAYVGKYPALWVCECADCPVM